MRTTTKAMIEPLIIDNREGRRLFGMKRAEARKPAPLAGQLDALADDVGQRHTLAQILDKFRWYGHQLPRSVRQGSPRRITATLSGIVPHHATMPIKGQGSACQPVPSSAAFTFWLAVEKSIWPACADFRCAIT